ncbi:L,D-transpeptidase [Candidatus Frankia nodulisporulans]|uniref:L,D-transpeptidase n=1 Tax=Candidatus Frankia nodulisporulans TaxID=2060052 RepID=UPI0013D21610|nr:L,D-transpeptidase [Candidatus Frankia nodulisporulans]
MRLGLARRPASAHAAGPDSGAVAVAGSRLRLGVVRTTVLTASLLVGLGGLTGCGGSGGDGSQAAPTKPLAQVRSQLAAIAGIGQGRSTVVTASGASVDLYSAPTDTQPSSTLASPNQNGVKRVFLVQAKLPGWWQVMLPVAPNGSTGWVQADQVTASETPYRIVVSRGQHSLKVLKDGAPIAEEPVAIGTTDTPTPGGRFYLMELLQPRNPKGAYGPYAFGLNGFSTSMTSFDGHEPVIGIHGTNEPKLIGKDVSHGCIRMNNDAITRLAQTVPLGTPVDITV